MRKSATPPIMVGLEKEVHYKSYVTKDLKIPEYLFTVVISSGKHGKATLTNVFTKYCHHDACCHRK